MIDIEFIRKCVLLTIYYSKNKDKGINIFLTKYQRNKKIRK
jgi:hypothetical protein